MSQQHYDRGGPQDYGYASSGPRRPPPPRDPYGPNPRRQPRGPPPMRPPHPGAGAPREGNPVRPPPHQQHQRPPAMEQDGSLYDGSAYGGAEYEQSESWPLPAPAPAFAQQSRPRSPGSPSGGRGQKRPPQRPPRPDYQEPMLDPTRSGGRPSPDPRAYPRGPPPPRSHHGDGQWTGDGYSSTPQNYPPQSFQRPPREPQQQSIPDFPTPQQQQAMYRQPAPRAPLGPPPSARRGPASYYPQIAPVHPIVEETDSYRGSIRNVSTIAPSHSSYASSSAIPIGIPDYYLEDRNSMLPPQPQIEPEHPGDESPVDPSVDGRDSRNTERTGPSPDPATFVRQASLGKKSKPTLTTVKSGERARKENAPAGWGSLPSQQSQQQRALAGGQPADGAPVTEKELRAPRVAPPPRPSYEDDDDVDYRIDSYDSSAMPAALAVPGASNPYSDDLLRKPSTKRRSSDILSSGTGLVDGSDSSEDSEKEMERQQKPREREPERNLNRIPSKELLSVAAALSKEQQHRPRSRSPLAPDFDPRVERIVGGLERGGALTSEDAEQLRQEQQTSLSATSGGLSEREGRRRPPRLDVDKVRDAEARGSLTSLPDLIRRATKVASNLDRGKTASRLGMGFFENSSQSDVERMKALDRANRQSGGSSMSGILASFPPPRHGEHGGMRRWSSNNHHNALPSTSDAGEGGKKKGRRCCGMPLWLFILLLVVLLLLVAAAVIVPVVLVVLPNQDNSLAKRCASQISCQNGGVAIADAGAGSSDENDVGDGGDCRCLCVAGYTGNTCGTFSPAACTTTSIGDMDDATVGNGIPAVLQGAGDFGLVLDGQRLLGLFAREDLTCQAQNALVTFSSAPNQRRNAHPTPATIEQRQQSSPDAIPAATTRDGLVIAASSTQSSSSPSQTASTASSSSSPDGSTSPSPIEQQSFAGAAVLYLFQSTASLPQASTAQAQLQTFLLGRSGGNASAVPLGAGWSADLDALRLTAGNGMVVT